MVDMLIGWITTGMTWVAGTLLALLIFYFIAIFPFVWLVGKVKRTAQKASEDMKKQRGDR